MVEKGWISADEAKPNFRKSMPHPNDPTWHLRNALVPSASPTEPVPPTTPAPCGKKAFKNYSFLNKELSQRQAPHADVKEAVGNSENWHFKGEGKRGSLGVSVGSNSTAIEGTRKRKRVIPPAEKANTEQDVQQMFDDGYYYFPQTPFWDGVDIWSVDRGTHCLWKGMGRCRHGGESGKCEYFHGECHGWQNNEELFIS